MVHKNYEVYRCDRCGHQASVAAHGSSEAGWGRLVATAHELEVSAGSSRYAMGMGREGVDLCPACTEFLRAWWTTGKTADPGEGTGPKLIAG
jgi:hypothetical protein